MPHYIRFLKPPRVVPVEKSRSARSVSVLITITTDLGDSFLAENAELVATLGIRNNAGKVSSFKTKALWKETSRELRIGIAVPAGVSGSAQLSVRAVSVDGEPLDIADKCNIVSAWSSHFSLRDGQQAEKLVQRQFSVGNGPKLRIWEETGNSIARHIWDAALACVTEIQYGVQGHGGVSPLRQLIHDRDDRSKLEVIELGTGCGIVGITLAQMLPRCSVFLTDLDEARDIVSRNIRSAKLAPESTVQFEVLDWDEDISKDVSTRHHDLIVVSDCTYNADSMPALVRTLQALSDCSPESPVMVALKRRHESEQVFFGLMEEAGFENQKDRDPDITATAADPVDGSIEIYCFRKASR